MATQHPPKPPVDGDRAPKPGSSRSANADAEIDLTAAGESTAPALPHERDEKVGATGGVPSDRVRQAAKDVKRGLKDTSRGTEADAAYKKLKK